MDAILFGEGRWALCFGVQKINLQAKGGEIEPKSALPTPDSADIHRIATTPLAEVIEHLKQRGVAILDEPVQTGRSSSICFRDREGNLIEVANNLRT